MASFSGPNLAQRSAYSYHVCISSGTFTPSFTGTVEVLVVAGGGGGGMDMGGGGGGGGVLSSTTYSVTANTGITVTVGAGGVGAPAAGTPGNNTYHQYNISATNGGNSVFGSLTSVGGGYGGSSYFGYTPNSGYGNTGGSGGGSSGYSDGGTGHNGAGTAGQGNAGGASLGQYYSGGGGGAGAVGAQNPPNGGVGIVNNILGTSYYWGGGGGGAAYSAGQGGNGGNGGGGGGGNGYASGGTGLNPGDANGGGYGGTQANCHGGNGGKFTGGGGGGGTHYNRNNNGGNGGSGIVVIRYLSSLGTSTFGNGGPSDLSSLIFSIDAANTTKGSSVEVLVVGGGGGGGVDMGGGGGAGGVIYNSAYPVTSGTAITVTIGNGGSGATGYASNPLAGTSGGITVFGCITALGGGGGGSGHYYPAPYAGQQGQNGASGGGDSPLWGRNRALGNGLGVWGQGYDGGLAEYGDGQYQAGGGGGAGQSGGGGGNTYSGNGGQGYLSAIDGTSRYWGGGGGGACHTSVAGNGGAGGGGGGASWNTTSGTGGAGLNAGATGGGAYAAGGAGGANTGGGGGGGAHQGVGGAGGSGIVIVRYSGSARATGGTITTSGGYTMHVFTTSGTFTPTDFLDMKDSSLFQSKTTSMNSPTYSSDGGGSYVFNGTNNAISILNSNSSGTGPLINLKTSQGGNGYTIIIWAKSTVLGSWRKLLGNSDSDNYIDLYQSPTGYWHQDGSGETLYVDGVVVSSDTYYMYNTGWHCWAATNSNSGTLTNPAGLLTVGNEPNFTSYPWQGSIAVVQIHNRVFTAAELLQNFNALRGRFSI